MVIWSMRPPIDPPLNDLRDAGMLLFLGMQGPRKKLTVPMVVTRRTLKTAVTDKLADRAFLREGGPFSSASISVFNSRYQTNNPVLGFRNYQNML